MCVCLSVSVCLCLCLYAYAKWICLQRMSFTESKLAGIIGAYNQCFLRSTTHSQNANRAISSVLYPNIENIDHFPKANIKEFALSVRK